MKSKINKLFIFLLILLCIQRSFIKAAETQIPQNEGIALNLPSMAIKPSKAPTKLNKNKIIKFFQQNRDRIALGSLILAICAGIYYNHAIKAKAESKKIKQNKGKGKFIAPKLSVVEQDVKKILNNKFNEKKELFKDVYVSMNDPKYLFPPDFNEDNDIQEAITKLISNDYDMSTFKNLMKQVLDENIEITNLEERSKLGLNPE